MSMFESPGTTTFHGTMNLQLKVRVSVALEGLDINVAEHCIVVFHIWVGV